MKLDTIEKIAISKYLILQLLKIVRITRNRISLPITMMFFYKILPIPYLRQIPTPHIIRKLNAIYADLLYINGLLNESKESLIEYSYNLNQIIELNNSIVSKIEENMSKENIIKNRKLGKEGAAYLVDCYNSANTEPNIIKVINDAGFSFIGSYLALEILDVLYNENPYSSIPNSEVIKRSIEFPPEYYQAGISIISYFSTVLKQKYPDKEVGIEIIQSGLNVTLIVNPPDGEKEIIEKALDDYGLIIRGDLDPNDYLNDSKYVMALLHKLEIASLEVKHTKELLYSERQQYNERINKLEEYIGYEISKSGHMIKIIQKMAINASEGTRKALELLEYKIQNGVSSHDEIEVKHALKEIREESPGIFKQISDLIFKGAITGTTGNLLYDWLTAISSGFPK